MPHLETHQIQRLLRAFHADETLAKFADGENRELPMEFSLGQSPTGGNLIKFKTSDTWHKIELKEGVITHSSRHGTQETIDVLKEDTRSGALTVEKFVRKFDFELGALAEPEKVAVESPLLLANDVLHMVHVASRIMESVQQQQQEQQGQSR